MENIWLYFIFHWITAGRNGIIAAAAVVAATLVEKGPQTTPIVIIDTHMNAIASIVCMCERRSHEGKKERVQSVSCQW